MKSQKNTIGLCNFLSSIGESGSIARQETEKEYIRFLERFFEKEDGSDVLCLKKIKVNIGNKIIEIPLINFAPPGYLDIDHIEIDFITHINMVLTDDIEEGKNPKISLGFSSGLFKQGTEISVKARYQLQEPCETIEQIRDQLNKALTLEMNNG